MKNQYRVPTQNIASLEESIAHLNRRAKRLGTPAITLEKLELERVVTTDDFGVETVTFLQIVCVSGEAPKVNGWTFIATLEHLDESTILRSVPGAVTEGEIMAYREALPVCDHCQKNRLRNNTYLLRNEQGTLKQVGHTCLIDFLGHPSPESLAAEAELLALAADACESATDDDLMGYSSSKGYIDLESYLTWVHMCIREYGWTSRSNAREMMKSSTADDALQAIDEYKKFPDSAKKPSQHDRERAKEALAWIRDERADWSTSNEYMWNLYTVCKSVGVYTNHTGIAASLFAAYDNAMEKARELKAAATVSTWQGVVGKRASFTLTCQSVYYSEGMYGTTAIYKLVDEKGNQFTWFSSNDVLEAGCTYVLKGSVKSHDEYKGVKQTVLTRCKVEKELAKAA